MAQQTRHGLYGGPRPVYGSFAGKTEALAPDPVGPTIRGNFQSTIRGALRTTIKASHASTVIGSVKEST